MTHSNRFTLSLIASGALVASLGVASTLTGCSESAAEPETIIPAAPRVSLESAIVAGDDQAVYAHIIGGTPVNTRGVTGDTPLHVAAALGRSYAAEVLVGAGADLEAENTSGVTPLFNAAFFCHTDVLQALIDAGARTDISDHSGTALLYIMETPWEQVRPIYEMVYTSIGMPLDEQRIQDTRPQIAAMLR